MKKKKEGKKERKKERERKREEEKKTFLKEVCVRCIDESREAK